ncbi:MAG: hydroxymethylbilane synthase [Verrucomicrobia bacterium]|nr:hydroxymethylbilane synthase [Verrucomicrobiota bacterium]
MELPIVIATRGSALALAQAHAVFDECRAAFPQLRFEIKVIKTTGDKLQTASLANPATSLPKGLFTKELEVALFEHQADLAVHSLKDLPTDLPAGLTLGAVSKRADVRDVLIYRDEEFFERVANSAAASGDWTPGQKHRRGFRPKLAIQNLPQHATVATSSTRRKAQLLALQPELRVVEIRGNVVTRLQKLAEQPELDALILAAAGLERLHFQISHTGQLRGDAVPDALLATILEPEVMLPCVGQGALGIEVRDGDERIATICERLNHFNTQHCVAAERAFLRALGGGCQSPVGAYADVLGHQIRLRVIAFRDGEMKRVEARRAIRDAVALGELLAAEIIERRPAR